LATWHLFLSQIVIKKNHYKDGEGKTEVMMRTKGKNYSPGDDGFQMSLLEVDLWRSQGYSPF